MLKVKSFQLSDDSGVNELLSKYRLAQGASIFVSNGEIMVPYEDGEPANDAQKNIDIRVQINEFENKINELEYSNEVVNGLTQELRGKLSTAEADVQAIETEHKAAKQITKEMKFHKKEAENVVTQINEQIHGNHSTVRQNLYEVERCKKNIELLTKRLK